MGKDGDQNSELLTQGSEMYSLKSIAGSTMLQEEQFGVHLPAMARNLCFPHNIETGSGAQPASCSEVPRFFARG
jgi:hypothetical protein